MKAPRLLSLAISALAIFLSSVPSATAQQGPAAPVPAAFSLEDLAAELNTLTADVLAKLSAARKALDAEAEAKRITPEAAQGMRLTIQNAITRQGRLDVRSLFSTSDLPTENETFMTALRQVEAAESTAQLRRSEIAAEAITVARKRLTLAIRTAVRPAEVEPVEKAIEATRDGLKRDHANSAVSQGLSSILTLCQTFSHFLEVETSGNSETLRTAINALRMTNRPYGTQDGSDGELEKEISTRIAKVTAPFVAAKDAAQQSLDTTILERKPATEMAAALDRFQKATSALLEIRAASDRMGAFDQGQPTESYRLIVEAVRTLQSGDFGAVKASVQMARNSRIALNGQRTEIFAKFLGTLETEAAESAEKAKKERFQKVTDRLVAVKEPADLDALASELARFAQESSEQTGRSNENWPQLAEHLTALATVWTSGSPVNWQRDVPGGSNSGIAAFSVPLRALRNRIERDLLVRALKIPELNSAPLSELPIETALDTLSDQLARNAEWRRLFQVLEARSNPQYPRGERLSDDALTGLRTFFAGQNYELAEQWGDAVTAYKEVLRTTSLRSPTAAAAERLKALSKAHPELGRPPAPTVPPPNVKKR